MGADNRDSTESSSDKLSKFCVIDVGSTTTKAILFKKDSQWEYYRFEAPTTVEKPYEDVTIGVANAMAGLQELTSDRLIEDGVPSVPCFATSSAGGGLAVVVSGLVRDVTARSAERVALGAGSIILQIIALDDGRTPYRKIEILQTLRPDMVLLAGGFDGGAVFGPVFLAELLSQSGLRSKLSDNLKLPVIYSGNADARPYVSEILQERFFYCEVPNIRPAATAENLEPARNKIHDVFMEHVMSRAPGYDKFAELIDAPILPTPAAVSKILEHVSTHIDKKILAIDIGGATTDIYTAENGKVFRTVSANLGMSYSILNVIAETGIEAVSEMLDIDISETELFNRIGNKFINPTSLPSDLEDTLIECAVASLAIRQAVVEHLSVLRGVSLSLTDEELSWSRLKRIIRKDKRKTGRPSLDGYDMIVGSGGKLSHSPRETAAMIMINALEPEHIVDIAVDSAFMFPQLGVLAETNVDLALKLFFEIGLVQLGKVVAPIGRTKPGTKVLDIKWETDTGPHEEKIAYGELKCIGVESKTDFAIKTRKLKLSARHVSVDGSQPGLIVDARGRHAESLKGFNLPSDYIPPARESIFARHSRIERGRIRIVRELAVSGEVYVKAGDTVASDMVIARSIRTFLRPFFIDIAGRLKIPPDETEKYLLKKVGDQIDRREVIAEKKGMVEHKVVRSEVSGTLEKILPIGAIVVRERQEQITGLQSLNVAKEFEIRPERVKACLRCEVGQEVEKGQWIAEHRTRSGQHRVCESPIRGKIREISLEYGVVVVEPLLEELQLEAWMPGVVESITDKGCVIVNQGTTIQGMWGSGGEAAGKPECDNPGGDDIAIRQRTGHADLKRLLEKPVAGLITSTMDLQTFIDTKIPFPIVVMDGFGEMSPDAGVQRLLSESTGKFIAMDADTQLRAGVVRPRIYILD